MKHPVLAKKLNDGEYEQRLARFYLTHVMMLLPLVFYISFSYVEFGAVSALGLLFAGCCVVATVLVVSQVGKRQTLEAMRREGLISDDYRPPLF